MFSIAEWIAAGSFFFFFFCRKPGKFFRARVPPGADGRGLAERLGASAGAKAFQTPGTSRSQRLIATRLPSHPGFCTAGQRLYLWAGMLSSETVRALGIGGHNYPSKLTPIEMNGSTPFSAGVIVAVCLAARSKARVYLGLQPEKLETASLSSSFLNKRKKKVLLVQICGVGDSEAL